ncbi:heme-binding domain-containing protein [Leptobacterium sp. I13]|uniref:heme-binding domain-containing protein n=1 Tax=Leptobacterium meishanense TaxID=3128904 RepID=UPI0030EF873E
MQVIKKVLIGLLIVFIGMQFIRPEKNISDVMPATDIIISTKPPANIQSILRTSCYDCHSNHTNYPWYNNIAPVSYWLADHVKDGKKHLNFSEWGTYSPKRKAHKMEELIEEVKVHEMPLSSYLWMHQESKLTDVQIKALTDWAANLRFIYQIDVQ